MCFFFPKKELLGSEKKASKIECETTNTYSMNAVLLSFWNSLKGASQRYYPVAGWRAPNYSGTFWSGINNVVHI